MFVNRCFNESGDLRQLKFKPKRAAFAHGAFDMQVTAQQSDNSTADSQP
jgi:hypothetical protein